MIKTAPLIVALVLALAADAYAGATQNVLVVQSFHQGWRHTDQINDGIRSVISPFGQSVELFIEYLDLQRNPDRRQLAGIVPLLQARLRQRRFAVVIVAGDGALAFFRRFGHQLAPDVPVVFCDVTPVLAATAQPGRETGVVFRQNHLSTLKLMLHLHPGNRRIVLVTGDSRATTDTATDLGQALEQAAPYATVTHWRSPDLKDLPAMLVGMAPDDLIYLPGFDDNRSDQARFADKRMRLIERWAPVPAYSSSDFFLGKGIVGGAISTGREQGDLAGQMALRILSGTRIEAIPIIKEPVTTYLFDGRVLYKWGIETRKLPPGSRVIDPVPGFLARHISWLPAVLVGIGLVMGAMLALVIRQRSRRLDLIQTNVELDGRIRERTAHLQLANQKLKKQAITDPVTNLANRRYIQQRFAEEFKKAQRYDQPMTLIVLDVDGFKAINNEHSYLLAEQVLRDLGQAIRRSIREVDLTGRFGGESFMVILPNTDVDQGRITAERIRKTVDAMRWRQGSVHITLSVALVQFRGHSPSEMLEMADMQLKNARSSGGNQIMISRMGAETPLSDQDSPNAK